MMSCVSVQALAVIRYNSGMKGILSILEMLEVKIEPQFADLCNQMDKERVEGSYKYEGKQKLRFVDRLMRYKKSARKEQKHGRTYNPGKYSASNIEAETVDLPFALPSAENPSDQPTSSTQKEFCKVCGLNEDDDEIIEDLHIVVDSQLLSWVYCDSCNSCFHYHCVGLSEGQTLPDEWFCVSCK